MDVLETLLDKYQSDIDRLQETLASGSAKSYDEYKQICGTVKGLTTACNYIIDLQEANEKGEYEDDD